MCDARGTAGVVAQPGGKSLAEETLQVEAPALV